ncbi:MAG: hypothetical protein ACOX6N_02880 [Patescibacteria group bacterium]
MKKIGKYIFFLLIVCIVGFGFYTYELHHLAIEGNKIFGLRCSKVNPPLIAYKNSFLKWADFLNNPEAHKDDDMMVYYLDYVDNLRKYVKEENAWLEIHKKFGKRLDFKLIEPWYLKQGWDYQYQMYLGYRDDAQGMLDIYDKYQQESEDNLMAKQTEARNRRNEASQAYFDFFNMASEISDWRKIFGNVPEPVECNDTNLIIPDTGGAIFWNGTPTPAPSLSNDDDLG